ncbi:YrhB domain-containing protein [Streptomyces sp. NBC_00347]|uniref:YrhB domain-containing protein n=1 Tax=Streptomyces sp. NBC_00347 TaxID=2975721 RepID=UPI002252FE47|nr:YrhB domain-containing protein [Streptomyces sp. NBC_00347]MCX5124429.1 YrhB domain-containing protein [Streptomyces sp. NBC_00347]
MTLSSADAFAAAEAFLTRAFEHSQRRYTLVLQPDLSEEFDIAWAVRFDSREHLDTGDRKFAPPTRLALVPQEGTAPHFPPSHIPVAEYLAYARHGGWAGASKGGTVKAEPWQRALKWLLDTYHGRVELAGTDPVAEDAGSRLFACRTIEQPGCPRTPMPAASVVVPKDAGRPFHPAADGSDPRGRLGSTEPAGHRAGARAASASARADSPALRES